MGGCASKNKQPKEEAYKPASAPANQLDFEEIVPEDKPAVASKPPMNKLNGSVAEGEKRHNEYRNSLVGPGGVILPNQPQVKEETDPSIPYIDASEDELDDEPTPSRSVKSVQPTIEAAIEPVVMAAVEAAAPPKVPVTVEVQPEVPVVVDVQPEVPVVVEVQPEVQITVEAPEEPKAGDDVVGAVEITEVKVPTQEVGDVEEDVVAAADTSELAQTDLPKINDTGESFVDEVLRGVAPQLMSSGESYPGPPIDVEAVEGTVERDASEGASSVVTTGQDVVEDSVEEGVKNGVPAAEDVTEETKEAAQQVVEEAPNFDLNAATGGIIQVGENSLVDVKQGFEFNDDETVTEVERTPSGVSVSAKGSGGPAVVQIGKNNKVVFGTSNGQKEEPKEFTGFRVAGDGDTDCPAGQEEITSTSASVGFIYSPYVMGVGFRVGDRYIMTAYHLIRDMFDKMAAQGINSPETHILGNKEIWIQFDYLQMGEYEFDNLTRFKFASFRYSNPQLDVVVIELETHEDKTLPPPIVNFCGMGKRHKIEFVGHDGAATKRREPSNLVLQPIEDEIQHASDWCKKNGFPPRGYEGLKEVRRLRFQGAVQYASSGSPGVVVNDDEVYVVALLTRGYPSFYLDVDEDQQDAIPYGLKLVEGTSMTDVYLDMKEQANLSELCDSIFGITVSKQS